MANTDTHFSEIYILGTFIAVNDNGQVVTQEQTIVVLGNYLVELSKTIIIVNVSIAIAKSVIRIEVKGYIKSEVIINSSFTKLFVEAFVFETGVRISKEQVEDYPIFYFTIRNRSPPGYLIL